MVVPFAFAAVALLPQQDPSGPLYSLAPSGSFVFTAEWVLAQFAGIAPRSDGAVFIADAGEHSIGLFDTNGVFVSAIGRRGRGPGEFERLGAIGLFGDTLWAVDFALRRIALFQTTGEHLETVGGTHAAPSRWPEFPVDLLPRGVVRSGVLGLERGPERGHRALVLYRVSDRTTVELATIDLERQSLVVEGPQGISVTDYQPLDDSPLWASSIDGSHVVVVGRLAPNSSRSAEVTIDIHALEARSHIQAKCSYEPVAVQPSAIDAIVAAGARMNLGTFNGSVRQAEAAVRESLYLPTFYPSFDKVIMTSDDHVWLSMRDHNGDGIRSWVILDSSGRYSGTVTGPSTLSVAAVDGSAVWAVAKDELGVLHVRRFQLSQRSAHSDPVVAEAESVQRCVVQ